VEGSEKGNAIGFLACRNFFEEGERFFIFYGDEPQRKEEVEECLQKPYAWVCSEIPDPRNSGVATISDDGRITEVIEKPEHPKSNWVAMGTIVANTDIFKYEPLLHAKGEYHVSSMMDQFLKEHPVHAVFGKRRPLFNSLEDLNWRFD
jgi:dTDP-glucose pyrophosphorylase